MITRKEFYFVRHGQTEDNVRRILTGRADISLNPTGRQQAYAIEPLIASLPIKTVCCSSLKRAQETKEIITNRLNVDHHEIKYLHECSGSIWREMVHLKKNAISNSSTSTTAFMNQVAKGINQALSYPGPVLIVGHGGIHWAMCCFMDVEHDWSIDNCVPVHFYLGDKEEWIAKKLTPAQELPLFFDTRPY